MMESPTEGDLKVWHIPQVPGEPFYVPVSSLEEATKVLGVLADYDLFQYEDRIKPDYCNASGLEENKVKKPTLSLVGEDGNAFVILGRAHHVAREAGWSRGRINKVLQEATSGNYDHLLQTMTRYFNIDREESDENIS